nr:hypothetical protein [uncultured Niameybacter sp.]
MSQSVSYYYSVEREIRRQMNNTRVEGNTRRFLQQYEERYREFENRRFNELLPQEMNQLRNALNEIKSHLTSDPFHARDVSFTVRNMIHNIQHLGREVSRTMELRERARIQEVKQARVEAANKLENMYYEILKGITDPIVRDFAIELLEKDSFKESLATVNLREGNVDSVVAQYTEKMQGYVAQASKQAVIWKEEKQKQYQKTVFEEQISDVINSMRIEQMNFSDEINHSIELLKQGVLSGNLSLESFNDKLIEIQKGIDEECLSEDIRKEAVKSIIKSLKAQEFNVGRPEIVNNKHGNFVRVVATKPSGKKAECFVDLKGQIRYKFDNYEGMSCLKDIEQFDISLQEVYSINLSDKQVHWENPIRISKDALSLPGQAERRM